VPRFVVTFRPTRGNGIHALRRLLKRARRDYGLVAVDAREVVDDTAEASDTAHPNVSAQFLDLIRSITAAK
jgi:hypothetical protein